MRKGEEAVKESMIDRVAEVLRSSKHTRAVDVELHAEIGCATTIKYNIEEVIFPTDNDEKEGE